MTHRRSTRLRRLVARLRSFPIVAPSSGFADPYVTHASRTQASRLI